VSRIVSRPIRVVDVGSRFGVHPSFRPIVSLCDFDLFEADPEECDRLLIKYSSDDVSVRIFQYAAGSQRADGGKAKLHRHRNPAVSSLLPRADQDSPMYSALGDEHCIVDSIEVPTCALDDLYLIESQKSPDFLKIDVEGLEPHVLNGSERLLSDIVAIRTEVSFCHLQQGSSKYGTWPEIHARLIDHQFTLLNLDYSGQGDFYSPYSANKYGMLRSTDACYLKNVDEIIKNRDLALTGAIFCLLNNAEDVALFLLDHSAQLHGGFSPSLSALESWTCRALAAHFHKLKWQPGQDREAHARLFEKICNQPFPSVDRYNSSLFYNPT